MSEPATPITVLLRIPGRWAEKDELGRRLPDGFRLTDRGLALPDGSKVGFGGVAPDDQFAQVFRGACRQSPTDDELVAVDGYTVNVILKGPGGSLDAARTMMQAGTAIIRAGGAGVFIDNSAMALGEPTGSTWPTTAARTPSASRSSASSAAIRTCGRWGCTCSVSATS